ncbi:MAG TPA: hypothetical protein VGB87_08790 [Vicinamibacteria bacterium]
MSRAGESVDDLCRACKATRDHTVIAADAGGRPLRVMCGFCGSQHNYRGGGDDGGDEGPRSRLTPAPAAPRKAPLPLVAERERTAPPMATDARPADLETLLRRIIREESGLTPVVPAEKWRGGQLVLRPANPSLQEKAWPIEGFFHKVVMLRNRLRTLEQQVNASALPEDEKVRLQAYLTACYGTLTSFNVLFAEEEDRFRGAGGE